MIKWCKIIEVLDNQVLFFFEPDSSNDQVDCESLHQMVRVNGVCADIKLENIPTGASQKIFDVLDKKAAESVLKTVEDLMEREKDVKPN